MSHPHLTPEEDELRDPSNWDTDEEIIGEPVADPTITYGITLDGETSRLVGDAARKTGLMPISRYIRHAMLEAARRDLGEA